MVLLDDELYACETCIKGHRSSTCKHSDRPLLKIKRKGRPATVCHHCRELRKRKQVHVRCKCGPGERRVQNQRPGVDSGCSCPTGGDVCDCCTPRKSPTKRRTNTSLTESPSSPGIFAGRTPPRFAELHPHESLSRDPSGGLSSWPPDGQQSDSVFSRTISTAVPIDKSLSALPTDDEISLSMLEAVAASSVFVPPPVAETPILPSTTSSLFCSCTGTCSCPGCDHHNAHQGMSPDISSTSSCDDPNACPTCLHCSVISLPASLPHTTESPSLPVFDGYFEAPADLDTIDEWIRQVSSLQPPEPRTIDLFDGGGGLLAWDTTNCYLPISGSSPSSSSLPVDESSFAHAVS